MASERVESTGHEAAPSRSETGAPRNRLCRPPAGGNLAAERMALDDDALRNLDAVAPWPDDPSPVV